MTTEELHPLTDLFLRRAASNPEEMAGGKWHWVLERILEHGSQADKDAIKPVYSKIMLDGAHREMMQELLNPEPEPEQKDMFSGTQFQGPAQVPSNTTYSGYQNQVYVNQTTPMPQKLHVTGDIEYTGSLRKVPK